MQAVLEAIKQHDVNPKKQAREAAMKVAKAYHREGLFKKITDFLKSEDCRLDLYFDEWFTRQERESIRRSLTLAGYYVTENKPNEYIVFVQTDE